MTTTSVMRLDEYHDPLQIRLAKYDNLTMPKIYLNMGSNIKPTYHLAKSLTKTISKVHKPKIYNKAIDNLINKNR